VGHLESGHFARLASDRKFVLRIWQRRSIWYRRDFCIPLALGSRRASFDCFRSFRSWTLSFVGNPLQSLTSTTQTSALLILPVKRERLTSTAQAAAKIEQLLIAKPRSSLPNQLRFQMPSPSPPAASAKNWPGSELPR